MFNSYQNDSLKKDIENLKTLSVYNRSVADANATKQEDFNRRQRIIDRRYNEEINDLNSTPVGGIIDFGVPE